MTRKDYIAIAAALKAARDLAPNGFSDAAIDRAADEIADVMARHNPRFDRARFLKAYGVE